MCACTNKSRGSGMHWVGGGFKSTKGQYPPYNVWIFLCEGRCFFCFFYIAIKRSFEVGDICVCTTVIITNKVCLNWIELNVIDLHSIQYSIELMLFDKEAKLFSNYFLATGKVFFFFRTQCTVELIFENVLSLKKDLLTIERFFFIL